MPETTQWTEEQRQGIETVTHHVLVSAAAGSGKTAVLAERCAYLVCDAEARCDVTGLLVVTFTRPAAAEMRERIEAALRKRMLAATDVADIDRLARQTKLLGNASIGTLHSFCVDLLREHFHLLDLDPAFSILDEEQGLLLRRQIATALFSEHYDGDDADAFRAFVDNYGGGNDADLISKVISTHALLESIINPTAWIGEARQRLQSAATLPPAESDLGKELLAEIRHLLDSLTEQCISASGELRRYPALRGYLEFVNDLLAVVESWKDALARGYPRLVDAFADYQHSKVQAPRMSNNLPGKAEAKAIVDAIREGMAADCALGQICRFSESEWRDGARRVIEPTNVFLDLVRQFGERFTAAKRTDRSLDFADLERMTLQLLDDDGQPSAVARKCRGRFRYVLVDEYQDINEVQDRILALLSREPTDRETHRGGNLFCVGDVKQSIYRFRLAQPENFLDRSKRFGRDKPRNGGQVIDLRTNFRSRAALLETLNGLFERLMIGSSMEILYDKNHRLNPPTDSMYACQPCDDAPVDLHLLSDDSSDDTRPEREGAFIAREIRRLIDARTMIVDRSTCQSRPLRFGDIAILLRSLKGKSDAFAEALRIGGIPVHSESNSGFFESQEIRDMLSLLAVLDNLRQDVPLAAVLRSPLLRIAGVEDEMAAARIAFPSDSVTFHLAVEQYAAATDGPMRHAVTTLRRWREMANLRPLAETLDTILHESGYLAFTAGLNDGEQRVANLQAFLDRARRFCESPQRQGLTRFRQFLDALQDDSDIGQPSIATSGGDAVRIMTIHRSKGLEFSVVFVPDLSKKHTMKSCEGSILVDRRGFVGLSVVDAALRVTYPSIASQVAKSIIRKQTLAEELRVLYVAATRACERLILVGTATQAQRDAWKSRWSQHVGPLPASVMLAAANPLGWVAAAAHALAESSPKSINIHLHESSTGQAETLPRERRTPMQVHLISGKLIEPTPTVNVQAEQVIRQLQRATRPHPHSELPAVQSVSQLAAAANHSFARTVKLDRSVNRDLVTELSATEIGDATHMVMEHIPLDGEVTLRSVDDQIQKMVKSKLLSEKEAASVDRDGVCWFFNSELGLLMKENATSVKRERTIYFPFESNGDPRDRTMVRGRMDVLIALPDRCVLIDYKTDRRSAEQLDDQVLHHRPQIALYAGALEAIVNKPVAAYLAFLSTRENRNVLWKAEAS